MWFIDLLEGRFKKHHTRSATLVRLAELNDELDHIDTEIIEHGKLLQSVANGLDYAIWAKDIDNRFVYANQLCCDRMLHCHEDDVMMATDFDIGNGLAVACTDSDEIVMATLKPMRFIEHNGTWWDTLKSPLYGEDGLIGTIGKAKEITDLISDSIRDQNSGSATIPIELDVVLCKDIIDKMFNR